MKTQLNQAVGRPQQRQVTNFKSVLIREIDGPRAVQIDHHVRSDGHLLFEIRGLDQLVSGLGLREFPRGVRSLIVDRAVFDKCGRDRALRQALRDLVKDLRLVRTLLEAGTMNPLRISPLSPTLSSHPGFLETAVVGDLDVALYADRDPETEPHGFS